MTYFNAAFGGLNPRNDSDAAVKFILNAILMDGHFEGLARLLPEGSPIGGIEGEPGWTLERRDAASFDNPAYAAWTPNSQFRAHVDPMGYELEHPEFFMDRATDNRYISAAMTCYLDKNPTRASDPPPFNRSCPWQATPCKAT
jgi:hypothetical protein